MSDFFKEIGVRVSANSITSHFDVPGLSAREIYMQAKGPRPEYRGGSFLQFVATEPEPVS
jgi:predicted PolB exonuclease-like 3'-5' exonuclease